MEIQNGRIRYNYIIHWYILNFYSAQTQTSYYESNQKPVLFNYDKSPWSWSFYSATMSKKYLITFLNSSASDPLF